MLCQTGPNCPQIVVNRQMRQGRRLGVSRHETDQGYLKI
jgi:hypothetical protein